MNIELPNLDWKPGGKIRTTWWPPPGQWQLGKFDILFKSLLHPYLQTNIGLYLSSKQIMEFWDAGLINQLTSVILWQKNLTIIFYTVLTKFWLSIIMIQAITYMTYWFTVAKTGQRKPLHQIYMCSKTMQQISLELCPRLVMVFMESRVLNPFIKYSSYCKHYTAQCIQPRYVCRVC